jgi:hypothetical protein
MDGCRRLAGQLLIDDRLGECREQAGRGLEFHAEGAGGIDEPRQRGIRFAQMGDGRLRVEPEGAVAIEQRQRNMGLHALDGQQAHFRGDAAIGGEAAHLAAGRQNAMTGHDDGKRIPAQRLSDSTRSTLGADPGRHFAVG